MRHISHEQRHRRPTICFDEIVNATGATSIFFSKSENVGGAKHMACISWLINTRKRRGDFFFVKTTVDVTQLLSPPSVSPQTCDKSVFGFLEVNFDER